MNILHRLTLALGFGLTVLLPGCTGFPLGAVFVDDDDVEVRRVTVPNPAGGDPDASRRTKALQIEAALDLASAVARSPMAITGGLDAWISFTFAEPEVLGAPPEGYVDEGTTVGLEVDWTLDDDGQPDDFDFVAITWSVAASYAWAGDESGPLTAPVVLSPGLLSLRWTIENGTARAQVRSGTGDWSTVIERPVPGGDPYALAAGARGMNAGARILLHGFHVDELHLAPEPDGTLLDDLGDAAGDLTSAWRANRTGMVAVPEMTEDVEAAIDDLSEAEQALGDKSSSWTLQDPKQAKRTRRAVRRARRQAERAANDLRSTKPIPPDKRQRKVDKRLARARSRLYAAVAGSLGAKARKPRAKIDLGLFGLEDEGQELVPPGPGGGGGPGASGSLQATLEYAGSTEALSASGDDVYAVHDPVTGRTDVSASQPGVGTIRFSLGYDPAAEGPQVFDTSGPPSVPGSLVSFDVFPAPVGGFSVPPYGMFGSSPTSVVVEITKNEDGVLTLSFAGLLSGVNGSQLRIDGWGTVPWTSG